MARSSSFCFLLNMAFRHRGPGGSGASSVDSVCRDRRERRLRSLGEDVDYKPYGHVSEDKCNVSNDNDALHVEKVDYLVTRNTTHHHTLEYDAVMSDEKKPKLIVRRGEPFHINVTFNRKYDETKDELRLVFEIGDSPIVTKGTEVHIILSNKVEPGKWDATIYSQSGNDVNLTINTPPTCFVGRWKFSIDVIKKSDRLTEILSYNHGEKIYILFNPWCKDDSVYFPSKTTKGPDEDAISEYVMNESGKIYAGNYKRMSVKPWNFGQFEAEILECVLWLLENKMPVAGRGNAVLVCRKLSALINACDEKGVMIGNWSGDYSGGTSPTQWVGSVQILREFYETKTPVKYGQCWVFSGLLTTALRTLGIPARSVTNFASAHDSDGSITIDSHLNSDGDPLEEYNCDSVWNFHVWNEAYMARPELPSGFGGWQACDATPQETSDGIYCCGPASVAAIKNGEVMYPYDAPFVFAEVNADRIDWVVNKTGEPVKSNIRSHSIGKNISTKKIGKKMSGVYRCSSTHDDPDREDLTLKYKHAEDSEAERTAVARANQTCSTRTGAYDCTHKDVKLTIVDLDECLYGKPFTISLNIKNISKEIRTITGKLSVSSVFYTGVAAHLIKGEAINATVDASKEKMIKMNVSYKEYEPKIVQDCMLKTRVLCHVKETMEVFSDDDDFRLIKPDLTIKAPSEAKLGEKITIEISFTNPLPIPLTECVLACEGAGPWKPQNETHTFLDCLKRRCLCCCTKKVTTYASSHHIPRNVPANEKFSCSIEILPHRVGERSLFANFNSNELQAISGVCAILVTK